MKTKVFVIGLIISISIVKFVSAQHSGNPMEMDLQIKQSLTFFSSFDEGFEADLATGDPHLYVAPSWEERQTSRELYSGSDHLQIQQGAGRHGDALWIENADRPVYFYQGKENINYSERNWEGAISFWLRLSPNEDLTEGYSDPIQLTDSAWNDGALYVDFTTKSPRTFRFAFFAEREIWDPQLRDWEEIPVKERPMVELEEQIFSRDQWVHVAFSFQNLNTGEMNGEVDCYINGEYFDTLSDKELTLNWVVDSAAIWLGYNYTGYFDELALFDRALSAEEIQHIYSLSDGIRSLLDN